MAIFLIGYILFLTLFGDLVYSIGIPTYFSASIEMFIVLLFFLSLITSQHKRIPHLWYSIFFFLLFGACSVVVNGTELSRLVFSLRILLRFFIFYWSITLLSLDDNIIKKINVFLVVLLLLQLPVVAVKFSMYGIAEKTMGAYAQSGSVTTMLPISLIFYLAGYYFLYRPKIRYILVGFGFILFSIAGKKRAVAFLYPLQFLAIYYYIYIKGKDLYLSKKMGVLFLVTILIVVVSASIFYFNETLNPERKVGGGVDIGYALDYAKEYTTKVHPYGYTTGRVSTTIRIFESLWKSGLTRYYLDSDRVRQHLFLFDSSEERIKVQRFLEEVGINYGFTSMNRIAFEYGLFAVVAYSLIVLLLARMCWIYYNCEIDPYWKAFGAGSVGFSYSMLFFSSHIVMVLFGEVLWLLSIFMPWQLSIRG